MDFMGIINLFDRGVTALEKIADSMTAGQQIPGVYGQAFPTSEMSQPLVGEDAANGAADAEAAEAKKRTRVSQAMRDEAKSKAEAAGVLEAAEKELGPWMKWGSKDCEKATQMALASSTGAPAPAAETPPSAPAPGTPPVNMEDRKARFAALCDALKAKCTPIEGEGLIVSYMRMVCGDESVTPGRFVSRVDFEERLAEFKAKVDATPVNPAIHAAQAPAIEPEVLPPAAATTFTPTPENARRITYLEQFPPTGEKFTQATKELVIQLLREGKPIGVEDVRAFCIAAATYKRPVQETVIACIDKTLGGGIEKPSITMLSEAQFLPFIDALIAADAAAVAAEGAF